jgi:beta-glucosidase
VGHGHVLVDLDRVLARRRGRRGFLHWSLLDNVEWAFGYRMRFGIIAVDRTSQARSVKPSGRCPADVIRANEVT